MLVFRLCLIMLWDTCCQSHLCCSPNCVYVINLNLSAVSFSLRLPIRHVTRRRFETQLATLYLRLQAVYSQRGKYRTVHTRSENVKGCVPTSLYSCIRLYKYERGRGSQCFPTQIVHSFGSL